MRAFLVLICLGLAAFVANAADETLYVRARPVVPLLAAPQAAAAPVRQLPPGEAVTVLGRSAGFVNVRLADGTLGWLQETDLSAAVPASQRLVQLEGDNARLQQELAAAKAAARRAEERQRQAEAAVASARADGADTTAELVAERDRLAGQLAARDAELTELTSQLAELEMAQEATKLLAAQRAESAAQGPELSARQAVVLGATGLALAVLAAWAGASNARRRIRRRYHGIEL